MNSNTKDDIKAALVMASSVAVLAVTMSIVSWSFAYLWLFLDFARTTNNVGVMVGFFVGLPISVFFAMVTASKVSDKLWDE